MPTLRICIPTRTMMNARCAQCLINVLPLLEKRTGYTPEVRFLIGKSNIDQARSMMTTDFYNECNQDDCMLFIDSDHVFSLDDVVNVTKLGGDVSVGIYCNSAGIPTCYMVNPPAFEQGIDNRLLYAGTGFMLIRHRTLSEVFKWILLNEPVPYFRVSGPEYSKVIPFFKQRALKTELVGIEFDWLGEDYTFCWIVRQCGGTIRGFHTKTLGHEVSIVKFIYPEHQPATATAVATAGESNFIPHSPETLAAATAKLPELYHSHVQRLLKAGASSSLSQSTDSSLIVGQKQDIVYLCGNSPVRFDPTVNNLGGSEQGVVKLAYEFAKAGNNVYVVGNVNEGNYDGVKYIHINKFDLARHYNIVIIWRLPGLVYLPAVSAKHIYVDFHDTYPNIAETLAALAEIEKSYYKVDQFFFKSAWHKANWKNIPDNKSTIVANGVNVELYNTVKAENNVRKAHSMCYTSCYTRGLQPFLKFSWPIIKQAIPDAELHICYGDAGVMDSRRQNIRETIEEAKVKYGGIIDHGRLSHTEVARLRTQCNIHPYFCQFPQVETDCLSIRESYYAGCVPVGFNEGIFLERPTVGVRAKATDTDAYVVAGNAIVALLKDDSVVTNFRLAPPTEVGWNAIAKVWLNKILASS